jgi:hypothetical protein
VSVKLCFFVKVRKAKGLSVAGGRIIGRMLALGGIAATLKGRMGCAGVANAGEDEGIGLSLCAGVSGNLKMVAVRGFAVGSDLLMI